MRNNKRSNKKDKYQFDGQKLVVAGLALMAILTFAVQVIELFKVINIVNLVYIGFMAIAFVFVVAGTVKLVGYRKEFKRAFLAAVVGLLASLGEGVFMFLLVRKGIENAFHDMDVMFMGYIATLAMLFVFYYVIKGNGQLLAKHGALGRAQSNIKGVKIGILVILATLVVIPAAYIFPVVVKMVLAGAGIVVCLLTKLYLCRTINVAYIDLNGRNA